MSNQLYILSTRSPSAPQHLMYAMSIIVRAKSCALSGAVCPSNWPERWSIAERSASTFCISLREFSPSYRSRHSALLCASSRIVRVTAQDSSLVLFGLRPGSDVGGCPVNRGRDDCVMPSTTRLQQRYDHRLCDLVRSTRDIGHATRRGVPRSTARGWLTSSRANIVTIDVVDLDVLRLEQEVLALRKRVERLVAILRLVVVLLKVSGVSLANARIPDGTRKVSLLRAIDRSRSVLPLRVALRLLRLSQSRYHAWKREDECGLNDMPSCPRSSPQQLTRAEVETIKEMVTGEDYRHVPTRTLAVLA